MSENLVSVIICTYNRAASLRQALETVVCQETDEFTYEVVVVDDESTDDTRAVIEDAAAGAPVPVRYVLQEGRAGLAYTRNRGVHEARGNWIVFFDDDQLAEPDWLRHLFAVAKSHEAQCVGGARRLDLAPDKLAALGPVCRGVLGENLYREPPTVLDGKELPTTGNLLIARRMFDQLGDFDPRFSCNEGTEFLNRLRGAGFAIWTAPSALCAHMISAYRTRPPYFRWTSLRWGHGLAKIDWKQRGRVKTGLLCAARVAQALAVNLPRLALARGRSMLRRSFNPRGCVSRDATATPAIRAASCFNPRGCVSRDIPCALWTYVSSCFNPRGCVSRDFGFGGCSVPSLGFNTRG
ncbi:MAG TPA: glycosyltransferase, partial [Candidatus Hydrogenedentes bacterium]|nr:glycosyltransferase [Candidatus Hydrogenedentota bacterium]